MFPDPVNAHLHRIQLHIKSWCIFGTNFIWKERKKENKTKQTRKKWTEMTANKWKETRRKGEKDKKGQRRNKKGNERKREKTIESKKKTTKKQEEGKEENHRKEQTTDFDVMAEDKANDNVNRFKSHLKPCFIS